MFKCENSDISFFVSEYIKMLFKRYLFKDGLGRSLKLASLFLWNVLGPRRLFYNKNVCFYLRKLMKILTFALCYLLELFLWHDGI